MTKMFFTRSERDVDGRRDDRRHRRVFDDQVDPERAEAEDQKLKSDGTKKAIFQREADNFFRRVPIGLIYYFLLRFFPSTFCRGRDSNPRR